MCVFVHVHMQAYKYASMFECRNACMYSCKCIDKYVYVFVCA